MAIAKILRVLLILVGGLLPSASTWAYVDQLVVLKLKEWKKLVFIFADTHNLGTPLENEEQLGLFWNSVVLEFDKLGKNATFLYEDRMSHPSYFTPLDSTEALKRGAPSVAEDTVFNQYDCPISGTSIPWLAHIRKKDEFPTWIGDAAEKVQGHQFFRKRIKGINVDARSPLFLFEKFNTLPSASFGAVFQMMSNDLPHVIKAARDQQEPYGTELDKIQEKINADIDRIIEMIGKNPKEKESFQDDLKSCVVDNVVSRFVTFENVIKVSELMKNDEVFLEVLDREVVARVADPQDRNFLVLVGHRHARNVRKHLENIGFEEVLKIGRDTDFTKADISQTLGDRVLLKLSSELKEAINNGIKGLQSWIELAK